MDMEFPGTRKLLQPVKKGISEEIDRHGGSGGKSQVAGKPEFNAFSGAILFECICQIQVNVTSSLPNS